MGLVDVWQLDVPVHQKKLKILIEILGSTFEKAFLAPLKPLKIRKNGLKLFFFGHMRYINLPDGNSFKTFISYTLLKYLIDFDSKGAKRKFI